jgi:hypothetical protein
MCLSVCLSLYSYVCLSFPLLVCLSVFPFTRMFVWSHVPILSKLAHQIQRRIALVMKPQVALANDTIYGIGTNIHTHSLTLVYIISCRVYVIMMSPSYNSSLLYLILNSFLSFLKFFSLLFYIISLSHISSTLYLPFFISFHILPSASIRSFSSTSPRSSLSLSIF